MPRSKRWHKEDIKAAVRKKDSTLRAISLAAGLCQDAGTVALRKPFPKAQHAIADFLGLPINTLWPQWYDVSGQRIVSRSVLKATGKKPACHRKKGDAKSAAVTSSKNSPHHPDSSARQARGEGVAVSLAVTPNNAARNGEVKHV